MHTCAAGGYGRPLGRLPWLSARLGRAAAKNHINSIGYFQQWRQVQWHNHLSPHHRVWMLASVMQRRQLFQFINRKFVLNDPPLKVTAALKPRGVVIPVDAHLPEHLLHLRCVFLMQLLVAVKSLRRHLDRHSRVM
jgi:hypothetical protein